MIRNLIIKLVKAYQQLFLRHRLMPRCKYYPNCSEYTIESVKKHGAVFGLLKGLWRIVRCNPFSAGGVDLP